MFYLTTRSTHFIYGHVASDIWYRTIQMTIKNTLPLQHGLLVLVGGGGLNYLVSIST